MATPKPLDLLANLATNVRRIREEREMTQTQLAELVSVDLRTVQRLESGTYNPRLRVVEQLCVAMKIEPGALLTTAEAAARRGRGRPKKNAPIEPTKPRKRRKPTGDELQRGEGDAGTVDASNE
jgi:transcriptional regulator with XRE-family HTH domain